MTVRWMLLLVASISFPAQGQFQPQDRFALTAQQVARTLVDQGVQIDDERVSLPANVVATEPNPLLDVLAVGALGDPSPGANLAGRSWIRLACHLPGRCLPFYAIVTLPESGLMQATIAPNASPDVMRTVVKQKDAITMRAGAHATLVMDDNRSHVQVAVISLENGLVGHSIRVTSADRKHLYVAEVVSASLLRRSF